jgi:hypothetical protein
MPYLFTKYNVVIAAFMLAPASVQAETLVTHYFEGDVNDSTSSLVAVGDRVTGTFTYDLDWDDRVPNDPNWFFHLFPPGFSVEEYPVDSPVGMSFTVGSLSHRTSMVFELTVDNDNPDDYMYIGSDNLAPTHRLGGYIDLVDAAGLAFSSERPPAMLDLSAFTDIAFWGSDGLGGGFLATLDVLRTVPEPATLPVLVAGLATCSLLPLIRRPRHFFRVSCTAYVLLGTTIAAPAPAIELQSKTIAFTGQPAPDGNGTFSFISSAHLNEVGQVAFRAEINEAGGGDVGIFRGDGGPLTQIVRAGQAAPDGNGELRFIAPFEIDYHLNDFGQVAFYAGLVGVDGSTLWERAF